MDYVWHPYIVWEYRAVFVRGALVTAQLTVSSVAIGLVLGMPLGLLRGAKPAILRIPSATFIEFFRSTPTLVQLVWIYYALPMLIGVRLGAVAAVTIGLGLHSAAYIAEIFRAGVASIDRGQFLAAKSIGMSYAQAMRRIILPQAVRRMVPPFINELANLIKLTTLGSVLAVYELLHESDNLINTTFRPFEIYTALALVFFVMIFPLIYLSQKAGIVLGDAALKLRHDFDSQSRQALRRERSSARRELRSRARGNHRHHRAERIGEKHAASVHQFPRRV